jgi:hypothetical protein
MLFFVSFFLQLSYKKQVVQEKLFWRAQLLRNLFFLVRFGQISRSFPSGNAVGVR